MFEEIPNVTGFDADRRADALALGIWPSHGHTFHGFEIKASRADWLRELQDPAKGDAFLKYCDHWWLLSDPKVALESEIPETWGWMEATKSGLRVRKDAPKLTPEPLPRSLMASMLRSVEKTMVPRSLLEKERSEMLAGVEAEVEKRLARANDKWDRENQQKQLENYQRLIQDFEARTGVQFCTWRPEETIQQVRLILQADTTRATLYQKATMTLDIAKEMSRLAAKILDDTKP